jgi:hypothetical protein
MCACGIYTSIVQKRTKHREVLPDPYEGMRKRAERARFYASLGAPDDEHFTRLQQRQLQVRV